MAYKDFMNRVRRLDNQMSKWLMRHFYFMFFQMVLLIAFLFWFVNMFNVIDSVLHVNKNNAVERILTTNSVNMTIIVFLLLLNSFWMLYIFNGLQRITTLLKDISFNILRLRNRNKPS